MDEEEPIQDFIQKRRLQALNRLITNELYTRELEIAHKDKYTWMINTKFHFIYFKRHTKTRKQN